MGWRESFRTSDELYHSPQMSPAAHILATAFDDPTNGGTGKDEPIDVDSQLRQGAASSTRLWATMSQLSRKAVT